MKRLLAGMLALGSMTCNRLDEAYLGAGPSIGITLKNFLPIRAGEGHYELWISFANSSAGIGGVDTSFVSAGSFIIDAAGEPRDTGGAPFIPRLAKPRNPELMVDAIITLQPQIDTAHTPGPVIIGGEVAGDIRVGAIGLSTRYRDAFGADFAQASGTALLHAATSTDPADSASGIWFMGSVSPPSAGFAGLPTLPEGWTYQGWVRTCCRGNADNDYYLNYATGSFQGGSGFDSDSAGRRPQAGFPFPGEDFTGVKRLRLNDGSYEVMVTIEPVPDNSPAPFRMLTLFGPAGIADGQHPDTAITLTNGSARFPSAAVTVVR